MLYVVDARAEVAFTVQVEAKNEEDAEAMVEEFAFKHIDITDAGAMEVESIDHCGVDKVEFEGTYPSAE